MLGIEEHNASANGGLIRAVTLVESVASYLNSNQLITVSMNAVAEKNNMIILRTVGSFITNTFRLAQKLTLQNLDLLENGESIIIKCEQKEGLGNAELELFDSSSNFLKQFQLAPSGTYLITRNAYTIGAESGYTFVTLSDGSDFTFEITGGLTNRHVGFGVYSVSGSGAIVVPQLLIPGANANTPTDKVIIVNHGGLCRISSVDTDLIYDAFGSSTTADIPTGVYIFQYAKNKIYLK